MLHSLLRPDASLALGKLRRCCLGAGGQLASDSDATLTNDLMNDVPMHIRQAAIDAVMADGELRMIDSQLTQDRGMDVINLSRVFTVQRFVAPFI